MKTHPAIIWNSKTSEFAFVNPDLGRAMIHMGNTSGFDRMNSTIGRLTKARIQQDGRKCRLYIEAGSTTLKSEAMGRVAVKKLAAQARRHFDCPIFNVKASGVTVLVPA